MIQSMMHRYDMCIGYDMYPIRRYVYFLNNRIWYVIDTWYMNIKKCTIILTKYNKYMIVNVWIQNS